MLIGFEDAAVKWLCYGKTWELRRQEGVNCRHGSSNSYRRYDYSNLNLNGHNCYCARRDKYYNNLTDPSPNGATNFLQCRYLPAHP
jgi:hypothetical protein